MKVVSFGALLLGTLVSVGCGDSSGNYPVVQTPSGTVMGRRLTHKNKVVDAFYGIPFARPPVGKLRFRKPLPLEPWTGMYNATEKKPPCLQISVKSGTHGAPGAINNSHSTEDCLYLNVWRPVTCDGECKDLSVFVYLFGGSFAIGDGGFFLYDGLNFVATTEVVYVTLNYRVGIFGFLFAGTEEAPGNVGLYDQNIALRWVKDNIKSFGGDPEKITLGGQSAGAASVGFHMMSPLSKGLFSRGILESGTPLTLAGGFLMSGLGHLISLSSVFNCYDTARSAESQVNDMVDCLRKVEGRRLLEDAGKALGFKSYLFFPRFGGEFLPMSPSDLFSYKMNAKGIIVGDTRDEGALFAYILEQRFKGGTEFFQDNLPVAMRVVLMGYLGMTARDASTVIKGYIGEREHISYDELKDIVSSTFGDFFFYCPCDIFTEAMERSRIPVYKYLFDHKPSYSMYGNLQDVATHAEDIPFFRGVLETKRSEFLKYSKYSEVEAFREFHVTPEEINFSQELIDLWASFIKTGKPKIPRTNKDWPKYTKENKAYLILKPNDYRVAQGPRSTKCHLWEPYLVKRKPTATTPSPKARPSPKHGLEKRPKLQVHPLDNNIAVASVASILSSVFSFVMAAAAAAIAFRGL